MSADPRFDGPGPDEIWRRELAGGRLVAQSCRACGAVRFPPALVCAACGSSALDWKALSGAGRVYSATTVREREGAYNVALVDLAEGGRMMSRVEGIAPDQVRIGMAVRARIVCEPEPHVVFDAAGDAP
jgi:uncharacterized OB-fold protein